MGTYIMLTKVTEEGSKTIKTNPTRIQEVNREIESLGVKILSQHAVFGIYDFINIVESPDNETMFKVAVELGSRGTMNVTTMPAIPVDEFISRLKSKSS
jgi:uncharacterized protein with GYD domain